VASENICENVGKSPKSQVKAVPTRYSDLFARFSNLVREERKEVYPSSPLQIWRIYTPRAQAWAWRRVFKPDPIRDDLPAAARFLEELDGFSDQELRSFSACNHIMERNLHKRLLLNGINRFLVALAAIAGIFASLKQAFNLDIAKLFETLGFTDAVISSDILITQLAGIGSGLLLNLIITAVVIGPKLVRVRALRDLISIVLAYRGIDDPNPRNPVA